LPQFHRDLQDTAHRNNANNSSTPSAHEKMTKIALIHLAKSVENMSFLRDGLYRGRHDLPNAGLLQIDSLVGDSLQHILFGKYSYWNISVTRPTSALTMISTTREIVSLILAEVNCVVMISLT
jgi:hypothetical protein